MGRLVPKMKLYVTQRMRGKMAGFQSLNTSPMGNPFCDAMSKDPTNVCSRCYSRKSIKNFHHDGRWIDNGNILKKKRYLTGTDMPKFRKDTKYFRFHAHGELLNLWHFWNINTICLYYPDIRFTLWSKRKNLIEIATNYVDGDAKGTIAENLTLIYSDPKINSLVTEIPPGFDRKFTVFTKEFAEENNIDLNCAGVKCMECLVCYEDNDIKLINELLR